MTVLLISANTDQFNMPAMPLGLACVAEAVKNAGYDVFMLNLMFKPDTNTGLKKIIPKFGVDNTFNLPPTYAKSICNLIIERGLDIHWRWIIYPKNGDEELVELMSTAGCRQISLGFESGSELILKNFNKQFTLEDVRILCPN